MTAVIWSWFAAGESHNRLSQNQAGMIENPGLVYGLFHAVVNPQYSWGVLRKVTFQGVNLDVGHVRNLTWSKDNNAQNWVAYNRLRGQYMSALEHAIPERFFNDPNQCNETGTTTSIAGLPTCPQGISAVKALGLAAQAGQKIYTITAQVYQDNPNIVNNQLFAHSQSTKDRIQQALDAGYEITIHEAPITQDGWTGAGFSVIDPNTGAGGYLIEGGSNGGFLAFLDNNAGIISLGAAILGAVTTPLTLPWFLALTIATAVVAAGLVRYIDALNGKCSGNIPVYVAIEVTALVFGIKVTGFIGVFFAWIIGFLGDGTVRGSTEGRC